MSTTAFNMGGSKRILWKNPNPKESFASQTITVPMLASYMEKGKDVYITAMQDASGSTTICTTILAKKCYLAYPIAKSTRTRTVQYTGGDSITFGTGTLVPEGGSYNFIGVPQEVYVYI